LVPTDTEKGWGDFLSDLRSNSGSVALDKINSFLPTLMNDVAAKTIPFIQRKDPNLDSLFIDTPQNNLRSRAGITPVGTATSIPQ
jgi:hypothetical protein